MHIIGINAYHGDSSACLVTDGELIAAAEEERFRRIKHWAGFPSESIRYCLKQARLSLSDIDHVAINGDPKANLFEKIKFTVKNRPNLDMLLERIRNSSERVLLQDELEKSFPGESYRGSLHHVEHHLSHLASAYFVSPFHSAVALSVDGFGDFASAAWGLGTGPNLGIDDKVYFPHSLGIFYMALTQYLGFPHWGDEYKVMGLAPYGKPAVVDKLRQVVLLKDNGQFELDMRYFRHHQEKLQEWPGSAPHVNRLFTAALEELLGPARAEGEELTPYHRDIARSAQTIYEDAFFNLLGAVHRRYDCPNLALSGGCAMNSVANGKIYGRSPFTRVYVQSAAGDAGGAIGAAYVVWGRRGTMSEEAPRRSVLDSEIEGRTHEGRFVMDHAYWGPEFSDDYLSDMLQAQGGALHEQGCSVERVTDEGALCARTAAAVGRGEVVGWFQGRMEWGPRALGNRSIIGDPRRADMKDILNRKIKRRESFRPFAPSILRERAGEWFEVDDDVPFMMQVYPVRAEKRPLIPAVTHVDGSGRLQTVYRSTNPRYYRLIQAFAAHTGIPVVLNTSFNENEPVVCTPEQALDCFLRTKMDVLVLGNWYVCRTS